MSKMAYSNNNNLILKQNGLNACIVTKWPIINFCMSLNTTIEE